MDARSALDVLYQWLHAHPELSGREIETAARIASELEAAGFEVTTGVGGTGVVGVLRNGNGPAVLVRTDMDALPIAERTGVSYASEVRVKDNAGSGVGVMHACGHDVHMSVFVGAARALAEARGQWQGTLVMIGQPAEETGSGARAMLKDGLFTRFPRPDYNLALHVDPSLEAGKIGYRDGYMFASSDFVDITIRGAGGHGAYPHLTKDPIVIAAEVIVALQTIVSREIRPLDPAVVTVGSIQGGSKHNIIPDEVELRLTVRSYDPGVREHILASIRRICNGIAAAAGVPEDRLPVVSVGDGHTPSTYNSPELVKRLVPVWQAGFGAENVVPRDPEMGFDDFSEYGLAEPRIPGLEFRLGSVDQARIAAAKEEGKALPGLHSSEYCPAPEPTIETGVKAMVAAVMELMS
jgi:amidohydrolase